MRSRPGFGAAATKLLTVTPAGGDTVDTPLAALPPNGQWSFARRRREEIPLHQLHQHHIGPDHEDEDGEKARGQRTKAEQSSQWREREYGANHGTRQLAHRIVRELKKAFRGRVRYQWPDDESLFAVWQRHS